MFQMRATSGGCLEGLLKNSEIFLKNFKVLEIS